MHISFVRNVFFFNDTATTDIYTLSLHDALPICRLSSVARRGKSVARHCNPPTQCLATDRKSTRLNSSHVEISYAVFCLKKKKIFGLFFISISVTLAHDIHHCSAFFPSSEQNSLC